MQRHGQRGHSDALKVFYLAAEEGIPPDGIAQGLLHAFRHPNDAAYLIGSLGSLVLTHNEELATAFDDSPELELVGHIVHPREQGRVYVYRVRAAS